MVTTLSTDLRYDARTSWGGDSPSGANKPLVSLIAVCFVALDPPRALNFAALLPTAGALAIVAFLSTRRAGRSVLPASILLLLVWFPLSTVWASGQLDTGRKSLSLAIVVLLAIAVGSRMVLRDLILGIAVGGVVVLALSVLVAVVDPAYGLMPPGYEGGSLRGIYIHRNSLGAVLSLGLAAALCVDVEARRQRLLKVIGCVGLFGGVLAAQSSTALASVAVMVLMYLLLRTIQRVTSSVRPALSLLAVAAVAGLINFSYSSPIAFAALDRSDSLTGRTQIWSAVQGLIAQQPWLGYGWSGVWSLGSYVNLTVSAAVGFIVPEAHNGYLDTLLQVGVIGLGILALIYLSIFIHGIALLRRHTVAAACWPVVLVVRAALYNITESRFESSLEMFVTCALLACLVAERINAASNHVSR